MKPKTNICKCGHAKELHSEIGCVHMITWGSYCGCEEYRLRQTRRPVRRKAKRICTCSHWPESHDEKGCKLCRMIGWVCKGYHARARRKPAAQSRIIRRISYPPMVLPAKPPMVTLTVEQAKALYLSHDTIYTVRGAKAALLSIRNQLRAIQKGGKA